MIDLHCHILPGIDDGATNLEISLEMARRAVADGVTVTACTPHIMPGYFNNDGPGIRKAIVALQAELNKAEIPLKLVTGADVHMVQGLATGLKSGRLLSLNDSRYFLFEPPHKVAPPRMAETVFDVMTAGYHPIVTHPERLTWIESHYDVMKRLVEAGAWMQITAGALMGRFGERPKYWSERMLDEGLVHIIASDAHNLRNRAPGLSAARDAAASRLGEQAALDMVLTRPGAVLENASPSSVPDAVAAARPQVAGKNMLHRILSPVWRALT